MDGWETPPLLRFLHSLGGVGGPSSTYLESVGVLGGNFFQFVLQQNIVFCLVGVQEPDLEKVGGWVGGWLSLLSFSM